MADDTATITEEQFAEEQAAAAAAQGGGVVPDQRPIAPQQFPETAKSDLQRAREADPPAEDRPMPLEAYEKAREPGQIEKADRESAMPRLLIGECVRVVRYETEPLMENRTGVIIEVNFTDRGELDARSGVKRLHDFAEVETYVVRTRDDGPHRLVVRPEQIIKIDRTELSRTA